MVKIFSLRLSCLFLLFLISISNSQERLKTVGILNLESSGISADEARTLTNRLHTELSRTNKYRVVEMAVVEDILRQQGLQQSGACTRDECVAEVGNLLEAEWMLTGGVGRIGGTFSVDVRMIEVKTRKIVMTVSETYRGQQEGLLDVMRTVATKLSYPGGGMPTLGAMRVMSEPDGVQILLNEKEVGTAPITISDLLPGNYSVQGKMQGYVHKPQSIDVIAGRIEQINLKMTRLYNLRIATEPAGARLVMGGKEMGTTPFAGPVPEGKYRGEMTMEGYIPWQQIIDISHDRVIKIVLTKVGPFQPTGQERKGKKKWPWILAGAGVMGGVTIAILFKGERDSEKQVAVIGNPPNPPANP